MTKFKNHHERRGIKKENKVIDIELEEIVENIIEEIQEKFEEVEEAKIVINKDNLGDLPIESATQMLEK